MPSVVYSIFRRNSLIPMLPLQSSVTRKYVTTFCVVDRVCGNTRGPSQIKQLAEQLNWPSFDLRLRFNKAALPCAYLTAYQGLINHGFEPGAKVLVTGASGGCGTAAIQLAKALGASEVVDVYSTKNEGFVKSIGADRTIDYETQSIVTGDEGYFDFVFDAASGSPGGEDYLKKAKVVLTDPSKYHVTLSGPATFWIQLICGCSPKHIALQMTSRKCADLTAIVELLNRSDQRPAIDTVFPFTNQGVVDAFAKLKSRRTKGKLIIDVAASLNTFH
ncbi:hypothetical protein B5M09_003409 [Aphanomyces astaci]|uniref:Enoyl reductase (ER) domain-containing protein n=1 Tax=Aphanomyces astaci TaxID=112090 RepID=A0A425DHW5_APHAT|nr:hypothetical protein B5M09_003409 [Aphanomyces astaci]